MMFLFQIVCALVSPSDRFKQCDQEDLDKFSEESVPPNTRKATKSAVNQYNEWRQWRTKQFPNQTPPPALDCGNADLLSRAIPPFLCKARKGIAGKRAEPYKADTIKAMYSSLNRYLVNIDPSLDLWKSPTFAKCRTIVSGLIRNLRKKEKPTKD